MDLHLPNAEDSRRLEVAVDGLPLFGGAQLALDTTLVSALHCDGSARRGASHNEGVAISMAERRKEQRYPELVGPRARARLVVLAMEVGGKWSSTNSDSPAVWLTPELGKKGGSCADELNKRGVCVGVRCWHAPRPELWQTACWNSRRFWCRRRRSSIARSRAGLCFRGSGVMIR